MFVNPIDRSFTSIEELLFILRVKFTAKLFFIGNLVFKGIGVVFQTLH